MQLRNLLRLVHVSLPVLAPNPARWVTLALVFSARIAAAAPLVITGDFPKTKEVSGAEIYDATRAQAAVEQGVNNYAFLVRRSPPQARWIGGAVFGRGINQTGAWSSTYAIGNGAGLILHDSPGVTVEEFYSEWSWDGIRPARNTSGDILIRRVWLKNIRDDAIEADHLGTWSKLRVEDSLIEDVYVLHSNRRGASATGPTPPHRVEYVGNFLSLGLHPMDLEKRAYPWSGSIPGNVSGQTFKTEANGRNLTLLFRHNVVKLARAPGAAKEVLNLLPANATLDPASGGNLLVWLGGSPPGLEMETIDGVLVPKEFKIDRRLWKVTDDLAAWTKARSGWLDTVWKHPQPTARESLLRGNPAAKHN
jgi:hypothetical protein